VELEFEVANQESDRRQFRRFDTHHKARYLLKGGKGSWRACTINNVSRKGVGIVFQAQEKVALGSTVLLRPTPTLEPSPLYVIGIVRWIRKRGNDFIGGIESVEVLDDGNLYYSPFEK
jgi:hypothetical protein